MIMKITGTSANMSALMSTPIPCIPPALTLNPTTIASATPNNAPDETPVVYGSARGFFITLCMVVPAMARPIPAIMANNALGTLYSHTMDESKNSVEPLG